jgi:hypothetical protein
MKRRLPMNCPCSCGSISQQPLSVWLLIDEAVVMITSFCIQCEQNFNTLFPLDGLQEAAIPAVKLLGQAIDQEIERVTENTPPKSVEKIVGDEDFLRACGISFPESSSQRLSPP